jgi:uncharacterized protein with HEPN domain
MYKSYIPYLQHILDECLYVRSVITDEMQMEQFLQDETLKRAVTRSLSIIGEATKKIPTDVKYAWQRISWRQMAGMRDRLVHDYMGVNYYIVWDVAKNIIPELTNQIQEVIDASQEQVSSPDTAPQTLQSDEEPL